MGCFGSKPKPIRQIKPIVDNQVLHKLKVQCDEAISQLEFMTKPVLTSTNSKKSLLNKRSKLMNPAYVLIVHKGVQTQIIIKDMEIKTLKGEELGHNLITQHYFQVQNKDFIQDKQIEIQNIKNQLQKLDQNFQINEECEKIRRQCRQKIQNSDLAWPDKYRDSKYRIIMTLNEINYASEKYQIYSQPNSLPNQEYGQFKNAASAHELKDLLFLASVHHKNRPSIQSLQNIIKNILKKQEQQKQSFELKNYENQQQEEELQPFNDQKDKIFINQENKNEVSHHSYKQSEKISNSQTQNAIIIYIENNQIWLPKDFLPKQIQFSIIDSAENQFKQDLKYIKKHQQSVIFQPKNLEYFKIKLDQQSVNTRVFFKLNLMTQQRTRTTFQQRFTHLNVQNTSLGYAHELILLNEDKKQAKLMFQYLICKNQLTQSVSSFRKKQLLKNIGRVPSKYCDTYEFHYTPDNYCLVRDILGSHSLPFSQQTYYNVYLQVLSFLNNQQNQSQMQTIYKSCSHFNMSYRFQEYQKKIQNIPQTSKNEYQRSIADNARIPKVKLRSLQEDMKFYNPNHPGQVQNICRRIIYLTMNERKQKRNYYALYLSTLIPIIQKIINIFKHQETILSVRSQHYLEDLFWFCMKFLKNMYPYFKIQFLKDDLIQIRVLVQENLRNFNFNLNRRKIGLQNLISKHLLELFSSLSDELTYRIWDYLIDINDRHRGRIVVAYTLLLYLQATDLLPLIPIEQFMNSVRQNYHHISMNSNQNKLYSQYLYNFGKDRSFRRQQIISTFKNNIKMMEQKFLKRAILKQKTTMKIPFETGKNAPEVPMNKISLHSIEKLSYPLPEPNYTGHPILKISLLLEGLFILSTLNINTKSYRVQLNYHHQTHVIQITNKNQFLNYYVELQPITDHRIIYFAIMETETGNTELKAQLSIEPFQKDTVYKTALIFNSAKNVSNQGQTVLTVSLCLKSIKYNEQKERKIDEKYEQMIQKLLDYDLHEDKNDAVRKVEQLMIIFQGLKNPLDQFGQQMYKGLRVCTNQLDQVDWIKNSRVTVEELKAIFYTIFNKQEEKEIRLQAGKCYQLYAQESKLQYFPLGKFLLTLITMSNISRKVKITYLFCLGVHYQNCLSKKITTQTADSLMQEIYLEYNLLNAYPFFKNNAGDILSACFYLQANKAIQQKKDITKIIQDWAYICQLKYKYSGIILGDAKNLNVLRSLLTIDTLRKIQLYKQCRFQITYNYNEFIFIWSAVVNSRTFSVVQRGTKFLNNFPIYRQPNEDKSTTQVLYNCENMIPLQKNKNMSYTQFTEQIRSNSLINYLLQQSTQGQQLQLQSKDYEEVNLGKANTGKSMLQKKQEQFPDWAIERYMNCIEKWTKCRYIPDSCQVLFKNQNESKLISHLEIISRKIQNQASFSNIYSQM